MSRPARETAETDRWINRLISMDRGLTPDEKVRMFESLCGSSAEASRHLFRALIEKLCELHSGLSEAAAAQEKLQKIHRQLTSPPFHPALFLGLRRSERGPAAMVLCGNARRVVACSEELDPESLSIGDEVLLSNEMNFIVCRSPFGTFRCGQTAVFDRRTADGRIVVKDRDEEIVAEAGGGLKDQPLRSGDRVRWDRNACVAFEKIEPPDAEDLFLEHTPAETFDHIGGLDSQIEQLQRPIRIRFLHSQTAARYGIPLARGVLLTGPPGTGKTMLARALANWMASLSRSGRARFAHFKPLQFCSMWWGESERIVRDNFRALREAGEKDPETPVVAFYDEIDSIGSSRGVSVTHAGDDVLTALMAELDGLESRGNILVVASTNRRDVLDPALLRPGRLGDVIIEVPRPNRKAATEIFGKHLPPEMPYALDGCESAEARRRIIDCAVSRIYAPNGDGELAEITFRDGKRRKIRAGDLINGASIANIARVAIERALLREHEEGRFVVRLEDVYHAMSGEFENLAGPLTPANCRDYLQDLPQDIDVVQVERSRRKISRCYRYIQAA